MKKRFALLLILPLLLVIGFLLLAVQAGSAPDWFSTLIPVRSATGTASFTAVFTPREATQPAPTLTRDPTATWTPTPSVEPTSTQTRTPTSTQTATPSNISGSIGVGTGTPLSDEINDGILKGNHITRALELYYRDEGLYPSALDELVPVYLPALPLTLANQPYFYRLFAVTEPMASEIYWLSFRVTEPENTVCTYFRRLEYWDCNFTSP